jgi:hypothetical protein
VKPAGRVSVTTPRSAFLTVMVATTDPPEVGTDDRLNALVAPGPAPWTVTAPSPVTV